MTRADSRIVKSSALVLAVDLDSESTQLSSSVCESVGLRFRSYPSVERMLESIAPSQAGCILIHAPGDEAETESILHRLHNSFDQLPVVFTTESCRASTAVYWMHSGVFSVLETPLSRDELLETLRSACQLSTEARLACEESLNASLRMQEATDKELEVLDLVLAGFKNKEIAEQLGITIRAVEDRRNRLMKKVKVESLAALIELAVIHRRSQKEERLSGRLMRRTNQPRRFVRGIEVWEPSSDGQRLILRQSVYRDAGPMERISKDLSFGVDEGLPGEVWQKQSPVFYRRLDTAPFVRSDAAAASGLTVGVGVPIWCHGRIQSIVVLLTDGGDFLTAAIEHWRVQPETRCYRLVGGVYSNCERLRRLSEHVALPPGYGLPGVIGQNRRPYVGTRFAEDSNAVRGVAIAEEHLHSGIGLPLTDSGRELEDVLLLFNSDTTPLFRMLQVWLPSSDGNAVELESEAIEGERSFRSQTDRRLAGNTGSLAEQLLKVQKPLLTGMASDFSASQDQNRTWRPSFGLAFPTFVNGRLVAITVLGD